MEWVYPTVQPVMELFSREERSRLFGGGNVAVEDAILLSRTCRKVYLVHRRGELRADKVLQDRLFRCPNVEMVWDNVPVLSKEQKR